MQVLKILILIILLQISYISFSCINGSYTSTDDKFVNLFLSEQGVDKFDQKINISNLLNFHHPKNLNLYHHKNINIDYLVELFL